MDGYYYQILLLFAINLVVPFLEPLGAFSVPVKGDFKEQRC